MTVPVKILGKYDEIEIVPYDHAIHGVGLSIKHELYSVVTVTTFKDGKMVESIVIGSDGKVVKQEE
jgi:hypothetical protein